MKKNINDIFSQVMNDVLYGPNGVNIENSINGEQLTEDETLKLKDLLNNWWENKDNKDIEQKYINGLIEHNISHENLNRFLHNKYPLGPHRGKIKSKLDKLLDKKD